MVHAEKYINNLISWWTSIEKKHLPEYVCESNLLVFWRERVLFCICCLITCLCPFILIPSLYLCVRHGLWSTFFLDVLSYFIIISVLYGRHIPLFYRAGVICFVGYCLGLGLLFALGPVGAGYLWLFGASVLGGAMIGLRAGIFILICNLLGFVAVTIYILFGSPPWHVAGDVALTRWYVTAVNFMILNVIITMTTALMLRGLKTALIKEQEDSKNLQESEQRYRLLAENANDIIWTTDLRLNLTYISPSVEWFRGYTPEEVMELTMEEALAPESLELIIKTFLDELVKEAGGEKFGDTVVLDVEFCCKDGSTIWMENKASLLRDSHGNPTGVFGISRDITDRRSVEAERVKSEGIFKAAKNVSFIITEPKAKDPLILEFSPGAEINFGYSRKEMINKPVSLLQLPENLLDFSRIHHQNGGGKIGFSGEAFLVRRTGDKFPVLFSTYPLFDKDGHINAILSVSIDVSEQKKFEKQIIQSEKMAALGGLVAGMVHEISTPLGVALTSASFLQDKASAYAEQITAGNINTLNSEKFVGNAVEASNMVLLNISRAVDLVDSFKQVAVDQTGEIIRSFNFKKYLDDIIFSLQPQIKKSGHAISVNCPDDFMLESYPGAFYQIVSNLVMNSVIHGFKDTLNGLININISVNERNLLFTYEDNGKGIEPENTGRIFDPFFTTRRNQGGTGLGLHIVYNIVTQRLSGQILCDDHHGQGALFKIRIPLEKKGPSDETWH